MRKWQPMNTAPTLHLVLVRFDGNLNHAPFTGPNIWACWQDMDGDWYGDHHSAFRANMKFETPLEWTDIE